METLQTLELVGYHGTEAKNSDEICSEGFVPSKGNHHWLGDGTYFYEEYDHVISWCTGQSTGKPKFSDWKVLKCQSWCSSDEYWDIDSERGRALLEVAYEAALEASKCLDAKLQTPNMETSNSEGYVINYACSTIPSLRFIVVRGVFITGHPKYPKSRLIKIKQPIFCVRDSHRIKVLDVYSKENVTEGSSSA